MQYEGKWHADPQTDIAKEEVKAEKTEEGEEYKIEKRWRWCGCHHDKNSL